MCSYTRIHLQLTSNTLWNSTTPVSITLTFSQTSTLQTISGVADIDSKGPRGDTTVAHDTTWELSTVLQPNTSLICRCAHNTKVCKCATCQDSKICCMASLVHVKEHLYSLNLFKFIKDVAHLHFYLRCPIYDHAIVRVRVIN